ncbi:MAG: hypothetical protein WCP03_03995 [Candidatus Saccharibacteria bacterium]
MKRIARYFNKNGSIDTKTKELALFTRQIKAEYQSIKAISNSQKNQLYRQITGHASHSWILGFKYAMVSAIALVVFMSSVVAFAQHSQPGGHLYGVKKASQNIRVWVQPSYIKQIVEDRKSETDKLIKDNAKPSEIDQAKHDYQNSVNKAMDSGYEAQVESEIKDYSTSQDNNNSTKGTEEADRLERTNTETVETHASPAPTKYNQERQ